MKKILSCAAVVGLLVASSSSVFAKGPGGNGGGASHFTPAYASQNGSTLTPAPNRSGPAAYAPGQQMGAFGSGSGHGASVYAPGFLKKQ